MDSGPYLQIPIQIWATVLNKTGIFEQKTKQKKKPWRGHAVPEAAAAQTQQWLATSGGHPLYFLKIHYLFIVYIYAHHRNQRTAHRVRECPFH